VVRGHTDLAIGDQKFAGNSQRRRRNHLLFHGTFLLECDLNLISELLPMPSLEPDYRGNRSHLDFVMNLQVPAERVKAALQAEWEATEPLANPPLAAMAALARERYATEEWNLKF
jgi:lipoate-protein ligase A